MPKTSYFVPDYGGESNGIGITWVKTKQELRFHAWYDHFVGFDGGTYTLLEFFDKMGITKKDCEKAWRGREA